MFSLDSALWSLASTNLLSLRSVMLIIMFINRLFPSTPTCCCCSFILSCLVNIGSQKRFQSFIPSCKKHNIIRRNLTSASMFGKRFNIFWYIFLFIMLADYLHKEAITYLVEPKPFQSMLQCIEAWHCSLIAKLHDLQFGLSNTKVLIWDADHFVSD